LPHGTTFAEYEPVFNEAVGLVREFKPEYLVVSLGFDTVAGDPICQFLLHSPDYLKIGLALHSLALPTLVVQEGGYAADEILEGPITALFSGLLGRSS